MTALKPATGSEMIESMEHEAVPPEVLVDGIDFLDQCSPRLLQIIEVNFMIWRSTPFRLVDWTCCIKKQGERVTFFALARCAQASVGGTVQIPEEAVELVFRAHEAAQNLVNRFIGTLLLRMLFVFTSSRFSEICLFFFLQI